MVLQRDVPSRCLLIGIWGTSSMPNAQVTIVLTTSVGTQETYNTKASSSGKWTADMDARSASTQPANITLACGKETAPVVLTDVLFGDVFACTGQSNMVFGLGRT